MPHAITNTALNDPRNFCTFDTDGSVVYVSVPSSGMLGTWRWDTIGHGARVACNDLYVRAYLDLAGEAQAAVYALSTQLEACLAFQDGWQQIPEK